jgi:hypothetical protein
MKFSTKAKYRMPTTLIEFLLERFSLPKPQSNQQSQWKGVTGPGPQMRPEGPEACNGEPRVAGIPATQFNVGTQLVMQVEAILGNGEIKKMKMLADTGAECNLIKKGFVPHHLTNVAREKVNLLAVNGQVLQGGNRKTSVTLRFEKQVNGKKVPEPAQYKIDFYEADIEVDGILSYAWMAKKNWVCFRI